MKETIGLSDRNYSQPLLHHRVNIPFYAHYLFGYAPKHLLHPLLSLATERDGSQGLVAVRCCLTFGLGIKTRHCCFDSRQAEFFSLEHARSSFTL